MPQDQKFEVPQELRHLAEENVERARQLYLQFMDGIGQVIATWSSASSDVIAPGFREVQERAVKLANENADAAFKLAKDVAQAKDLHESIVGHDRILWKGAVEIGFVDRDVLDSCGGLVAIDVDD